MYTWYNLLELNFIENNAALSIPVLPHVNNTRVRCARTLLTLIYFPVLSPQRYDVPALVKLKKRFIDLTSHLSENAYAFK